MRDFPQELVDEVIDDVASFSQPRDLAAYGSVCSRWLPRSRLHLFSHLAMSNTAILRFMDLVDDSPVLILPLVPTGLIARLKDRLGPEELCLKLPAATSTQQTQFLLDLALQIPHFGGATVSRLELGLGSDTPIHAIVAIISSLPLLTLLQLSGGGLRGYGLVDSESTTRPLSKSFPTNVHTLDISLERGTDLFFAWLISQPFPPVFTRLSLGGCSNGGSIEPIEAYFHHSGSHLESLSLSYRVDGAIPTQSFEYRVLGLTPRLKTLSLTGQHPETVPTTLRTPMSASLTRLTLGMRYSSPMDWPLIDALLATQHYAALEHVAFTEGISKRNTITPEIKALMPRGTARNLFVSQSADEHGLPRAPLGALVFATRHRESSEFAGSL
ncbi:hypothetical protein C8F04DRAFT_1240050 [Mycena alexandri]|uniref:F-box domain-containing protein n=1 Tax=Mycena alexandri TaxID=1745969 RepID=A0AAD6WSJ7_9AGAR|nr:hypothetical protein C8F04DRAFT_1240050 [Mycena alexandri]